MSSLSVALLILVGKEKNLLGETAVTFEQSMFIDVHHIPGLQGLDTFLIKVLGF